MDEPIIIVSSITHAYRGQNVLNNHGIRAYMERNTQFTRRGCGYLLKIKGDLRVAEQILRSNGVRILKVLDKGEGADS